MQSLQQFIKKILKKMSIQVKIWFEGGADMKISLKAAAKVNLILDMTAVLQNGYHSIYTVMQSVGIYDEITLSVNDSGIISLTCNDKDMPLDNRNTAYKAAQFFFEHINDNIHGVEIDITKVIPSQAGMAGGSSDAAAVIVGLDRILGTKLSVDELYAIGKKVGADVPFCITGGTRLCLNIGEVMAKLPDLPECYMVIAKPDQGVSTKEAYANYDSAEWIRHPDNEGFLFAATQSDLKTMCQKAANVFEQVVEVQDRVKIKSIMRNHNAKLAMMTGSGAAIFGIFENEKDAHVCAQELRKNFANIFETIPVKKNIEIIE